MTEHDEGIFRGAGGLKFYYQRWRPKADSPRAVLALVRSLHSHAGLYTAVETRLVPQGYALYGFAHREQGRSPGQVGYQQEWGESLADVQAFLDLVREAEPEPPLFLMGNALGGRMVQAYALHHPEGLAGAAVFDPAGVREDSHPLLMRLIRSLSQIWPGYTIAAQQDSPGRADDPSEEIQTGSDDTDRLQLEGTTAVQHRQASEADRSIPLLILDDEVAPGTTSQGNAADYDRALNALERWMEQLL